jgi:hypothetical protein
LTGASEEQRIASAPVCSEPTTGAPRDWQVNRLEVCWGSWMCFRASHKLSPSVVVWGSNLDNEVSEVYIRY